MSHAPLSELANRIEGWYAHRDSGTNALLLLIHGLHELARLSQEAAEEILDIEQFAAQIRNANAALQVSQIFAEQSGCDRFDAKIFPRIVNNEQALLRSLMDINAHESQSRPSEV